MNRVARFRLIVVPLVILLLTAQTALATHWEPGYQNYGRGSTTACYVSGDRFTSFAYVRWTAAQANNLRQTGKDYGNGQLRYTQDMRDANDNVDADGYWVSNFDNPKFDNESDGGTVKREEAEMTAQSANFPTADKLYQFSARYSHYYGCGNRQTFDGGSGNIGHNEHMSQQNIFGEWDTFNFSYSSTKYVFYPSAQAPASSLQDVSGEAEVLAEEAPTLEEHSQRATVLRAPPGAPLQVIRDGTGVFVDPDLSAGLDQFRGEIHRLGRERVARGGGIEVVLTFSHPLTAQDLARLAGSGVGIHAFEAIGRDSEGERASAGAPYGSGAWEELSAFALEASGIVLDGVISAEARVADPQLFASLIDDPQVYLVDASPQLAMESARLAGPPSVNDVYWYLAGWEPVEEE